jgi:ubiquitin-associated SH3 domain-containing protein
VLYTHTPQAPDELDLLDGDFIFVDESEIENSPDGWYQGTSWLTGCTGMFAGNYTERTGETETWTMHRWALIICFISFPLPT